MAHIQLDLPPTDERDRALGRYMDEWSMLETVMRFVFRELTATEDAVGSAIYASMTNRQLQDLFNALSPVRLNDFGAAKLTALTNRLHKQNTKRNRLVHGAWHCRYVIEEGDYAAQWIRVYASAERSQFEVISHHDHPDIREKFAFTIPQVNAASGHVGKLKNDFSEFLGAMPVLKFQLPQPEG